MRINSAGYTWDVSCPAYVLASWLPKSWWNWRRRQSFSWKMKSSRIAFLNPTGTFQVQLTYITNITPLEVFDCYTSIYILLIKISILKIGCSSLNHMFPAGTEVCLKQVMDDPPNLTSPNPDPAYWAQNRMGSIANKIPRQVFPSPWRNLKPICTTSTLFHIFNIRFVFIFRMKKIEEKTWLYAGPRRCFPLEDTTLTVKTLHILVGQSISESISRCRDHGT